MFRSFRKNVMCVCVGLDCLRVKDIYEWQTKGDYFMVSFYDMRKCCSICAILIPLINRLHRLRHIFLYLGFDKKVSVTGVAFLSLEKLVLEPPVSPRTIHPNTLKHQLNQLLTEDSISSEGESIHPNPIHPLEDSYFSTTFGFMCLLPI
jgi:hypothetical protein